MSQFHGNLFTVELSSEYDILPNQWMSALFNEKLNEKKNCIDT